MKPLSDEEFSARLEAIKSGPWMQRSALARKKLSVPDIQFVDLLAADRVNLDALTMGRRASFVVRELTTTFKWHGEGRIPTHAERRVRDSFDDALTYLQMIELAIETGYLPAEQAAKATRGDFVSLLWAEPARQFVRIYDYTSIEVLATRLRVDGLQQRPLRVVDPGGAVHFASFLATHRAIENDPACETWIEFLDDYVIRRGEQQDFHEFLQSGEAARSKRRLTLLLGARNFAVMLADFLSTLPESLQARFGGFYAYWLAKLFGYELQGGTYVRDFNWSGTSTGWAQALKSWHWARAQSEDDEGREEAALVERSIDVLATTWQLLSNAVSATTPASSVQLQPLGN